MSGKTDKISPEFGYYYGRYRVKYVNLKSGIRMPDEYLALLWRNYGLAIDRISKYDDDKYKNIVWRAFDKDEKVSNFYFELWKEKKYICNKVLEFFMRRYCTHMIGTTAQIRCYIEAWRSGCIDPEGHGIDPEKLLDGKRKAIGLAKYNNKNLRGFKTRIRRKHQKFGKWRI